MQRTQGYREHRPVYRDTEIQRTQGYMDTENTGIASSPGHIERSGEGPGGEATQGYRECS